MVLYGYKGADADAEQLALTEQLFDAALEELGVVARGQPSLIAGISTWSPPRFLAWPKGFRLGSGLTWRLPGRWLVGFSLLLLASAPGILLAVIGGISWLVALWLLLRYLIAGWLPAGGSHPIWLFFRTLIVVDGHAGSHSLSSALLFGLVLGWRLLLEVGVRCRGFGRFTMAACSLWPWLTYFGWVSLLGKMMFLVLGWWGCRGRPC